MKTLTNRIWITNRLEAIHKDNIPPASPTPKVFLSYARLNDNNNNEKKKMTKKKKKKKGRRVFKKTRRMLKAVTHLTIYFILSKEEHIKVCKFLRSWILILQVKKQTGSGSGFMFWRNPVLTFAIIIAVSLSVLMSLAFIY